jgi:pimeloyl-ACP methyl ester carboxylesterase
VELRLPEPEAFGFADVAGVQIAWQSFGHGESAVLVVPTWNFVDSRVSAPLVPDLSPWFRVITFDPRGAGAATGRRRVTGWTTTSRMRSQSCGRREWLARPWLPGRVERT